MWKDFGTRFHNILERLCYHRDLIASQAALVHFRQYQEDRQSTITQFEETREKMIDHFEKTEIMERHKVYTLVMEWISGAQTQLDHEACCQERAQYPGTGEWILKHDKIKDWREADTPVSSILWLNGIPGAGTDSMILPCGEGCARSHVARQNHTLLRNHCGLSTRQVFHHQLLLL